MLSDTIVAIATADEDSAISIIKLSGAEAIDIVNDIFSRDLHSVNSHTITYGMIHEEGKDIDEVLVSVFKAPKSFTRENIVEINCHGGRYITRKILGLCLANGARLASNGEFTKRAFLNGRLDLTQAEAINDMIDAQDEANIKLAIEGIKGSVKLIVDPLIEDLLNIIAHIEVNIDYPEYDDVEELSQKTLTPLIEQWLVIMEEVLRKANSTRIIKKGIKTTIVGKPNVGKSSLLNALLEENKAIVTNVAGTTRDLVEGVVILDNITLHLIDTAGIRETEDVVEKIGIDRSIKAIEEAELCIVVLNSEEQLDELDKHLLELTKHKQRIVVYNKSDKKKIEDGINISALNEDINELIDEINKMFREHTAVIGQPSLNNERQIACLMTAKHEMQEALNGLQAMHEIDLITINLQEAYGSLKDILGQRNRDDLIDVLFSKFCLGK